MDPVLLLDVLLLILAVLAAVAAMLQRDLLGSVMLMGIYSLLMAVIWANLFAMDVSFTEASVGAGAATVLLLMALTRVGTRERSGGDHSLPALVLVVLTGVVLLYGTSELPRFGDPQAPAQLHIAPRYLAQDIGKVSDSATPQNSPHGEGDFGHHVPNTVTAVLASYRGYDTMFETAVIFSAGMCLLLLLRPIPRRSPETVTIDESGSTSHQKSESVVLRTIGGMLIPYILVFGFYVQMHGEIGPGGGFQAGVLVAAAFILHSLLFGRAATDRWLPRWLVDLAMSLGVLLYAGTGVACMAMGGHFLDYSALDRVHPAEAEALGMTLVEAGVGLTVASVVLTIVRKVQGGTR